MRRDWLPVISAEECEVDGLDANFIVQHCDGTDCTVVFLDGEVHALGWPSKIISTMVCGSGVVVKPWFDIHLFGCGWVIYDCFREVLHAFLHTREAGDLKCHSSARVDTEDMVECELNVVLLDHLWKLLEFGTLTLLECEGVWQACEMEWPVICGQCTLECFKCLAPLFVRSWYLYCPPKPNALDVVEGMVDPDAAVFSFSGRVVKRVHLGTTRVVAHFVSLPDDVLSFQLQKGLFRPFQCFIWLICELLVQNKPKGNDHFLFPAEEPS